ncbi:uncharacterized protein gpsm1a isoform X2 [Channa argus]|uniref:uncharacterized protein gpsm1a isoform X2 n=1 Tax=Channa argus TaxID=215402 RepID=UPI003521AE7D
MASPTSDHPMPPISIMADKKHTSLPSSSLSSPSHQNGSVGGTGPKQSPTPHQNGGLKLEQGHDSPHNSSPVPPTHSAPSSRTLAPLRYLRSPEGSSRTPRPQDQSLSSAMSFRTRISESRSRCKSSQQEESDFLIDLILESQGQRLNDQRASLSLLPDTGPPALCGTCSPNQPPMPTLDFYYMLIKYQTGWRTRGAAFLIWMMWLDQLLRARRPSSV